MKIYFKIIIFFIFLIKSFDFEEGENEKVAAHVDTLTVDSKLDHLVKFQSIVNKLNKLLLSYKLCIDRIKLETLEKIRNYCLGEKNELIENDINYEMLRVIGQTEKKIKYIMINYCFVIASSNMTYQDSCDILQTDVLDLLWRKYDTMEIIKANREKYIFDHGKLPSSKFDELCLRLDKVIDNNNEIILEIMNWKGLIISQIKDFVDSIKNLPQYLDKKKYNGLVSNFIKQIIGSLASQKSINFNNIKLEELKKISKRLKDRDGSIPINPDTIIKSTIQAEQEKEQENNKGLSNIINTKNQNEILKEKIWKQKEEKIQNDIKDKSSENDKESDNSSDSFTYIIYSIKVLFIIINLN